MNELTNILFSEVNITLTILLILLIVYWIFNMISGIDFDVDFDVDVDVDIDMDVDTDIDIEGHGGTEGADIEFGDLANTEIDKDDVVRDRRKQLKWWQIILIYFNFVGLPFMFTFTFWIFIWWLSTTTLTVITNTYESSLGFLIMLIMIFPSLFITKILTTPFKSFFKGFNQDGDKQIDFIGRRGVLQTTIKDDRIGTCEIRVNSKVLTVYVKSLNKEEINYHTEVLIIKESSDKNFYYVKSYTNLNH